MTPTTQLGRLANWPHVSISKNFYPWDSDIKPVVLSTQLSKAMMVKFNQVVLVIISTFSVRRAWYSSYLYQWLTPIQHCSISVVQVLSPQWGRIRELFTQLWPNSWLLFSICKLGPWTPLLASTPSGLFTPLVVSSSIDLSHSATVAQTRSTQTIGILVALIAVLLQGDTAWLMVDCVYQFPKVSDHIAKSAHRKFRHEWHKIIGVHLKSLLKEWRNWNRLVVPEVSTYRGHPHLTDFKVHWCTALTFYQKFLLSRAAENISFDLWHSINSGMGLYVR